jgi:hypothetical protein
MSITTTAGFAAGVSQITAQYVTDAILKAGQEFTIAGSRYKYRITSVSVATNVATINFFPALDLTILTSTVVTPKLTTLTPALESLVVDLAAAKTAISKPLSSMNVFMAEDYWTAIGTQITAIIGTDIPAAISALGTGNGLIGANRTLATNAIGIALTRLGQAVTDIGTGRGLSVFERNPIITAIGASVTQITSATDALTSGNTLIVDQRDEMLAAITLMTTATAQARSDIASARTYFNKVNVGNPDTEYLRSAETELGASLRDFDQARGFLNDYSTSGTYRQQAASQLSVASERLAQARTYLELDQVTLNQYTKTAGAEIQAAMAKLSEARANMEMDSTVGVYQNQAMSQLRVAGERLSVVQGYISRINAKALLPKVAQYYEAWGQRKLSIIIPRLRAFASQNRGGPRSSRWLPSEN